MVKMTVEGFSLINSRFDELSNIDMKAMLNEIGGYVVSETQYRFEEGKAPNGSSWKASLRAALKGGQTLLDTGRLMQSITHQVSKNSVEVGSNVIYAAIHQFGGQAGRSKSANIPARAYLGLSAEDSQEIEIIVSKYLTPK